ncbi:MAG: triose-phosphate isomerase [Spirochaetes bacterium]|nr:triose-phosphate isomerase [Spirochaetota bacterium]
MRKYLMAGNWKMNLVPSEAKKFAQDLVKSIDKVDDDVVIMIAPTFTALSAVSEVVKGSLIKLGAQNMNENESGAYTGEISADMLLDSGVEYVILGHSERRNIYKESDELINKKVKVALNKGLKPVLCVGELLEEREAGKTNDVVKSQVVKGLQDVTAAEMGKVVIAYEPVWAIGTGKVATPETAEEVHAMIRSTLESLYGKDIAENTTIQYGGSVKDSNVDGLMNMTNIDGALVGGASLKVDSFTRIAQFQK